MVEVQLKAVYVPREGKFEVTVHDQVEYMAPDVFRLWVSQIGNPIHINGWKVLIEGRDANVQMARIREYFELVLSSYDTWGKDLLGPEDGNHRKS